MEDKWDDPRLRALAPPRVLLAPLEERAKCRGDREGTPLAVLRHAGLEPYEAPAPVDLTPREREHLGASPSRLEGEAHAVGDFVPQAPDGQDAEEVVQDAFWTVVRKIDSFRGESAFGSWLYRIVANAAYQKLRTRQSRRRDVSWDDVMPVFDERGCHAVPMADWSPRVDDPSIQTELRLALTSAIEELPAAYRSVLVLRDVRGLSNPEIAEVMGLSIPVVKTRVHRARLFLRKQLGDAMTTLDAADTHECA